MAGWIGITEKKKWGSERTRGLDRIHRFLQTWSAYHKSTQFIKSRFPWYIAWIGGRPLNSHPKRKTRAKVSAVYYRRLFVGPALPVHTLIALTVPTSNPISRSFMARSGVIAADSLPPLVTILYCLLCAETVDRSKQGIWVSMDSRCAARKEHY